MFGKLCEKPGPLSHQEGSTTHLKNHLEAAHKTDASRLKYVVFGSAGGQTTLSVGRLSSLALCHSLYCAYAQPCSQASMKPQSADMLIFLSHNARLVLLAAELKLRSLSGFWRTQPSEYSLIILGLEVRNKLFNSVWKTSTLLSVD